MQPTKSFFLSLLAFFLLIFPLSPEEISENPQPEEKTYGTPVHEDENDGRKHYLTAITGMIFPELTISFWCRNVIDADWAQVPLETLAHPLERQPEFDTDYVWTNFVLHPFQGSLYYMAARNSNLNRAEALGITALGDFLWEWFFETTEPSLNDLVYSFLGGFAVGEMVSRLALEAEYKASPLGYILNPPRLWTEAWSKSKPKGTVGNIHEFTVKFNVGTMHSYTKSGYSGLQDAKEIFPVYFSPDINVVYNDPYGHDSNEPYSQFEFRFGGGIGKSAGHWRGMSSIEKYIMYDVFIFSNGMLFSRAPDFGENKDTSVGIVLDYDFKWQSLIDLAAIAPGFAFKQRINYEKSRIEWQHHLCWNIIGITDYYYFHRAPSLDLSFGNDYSYLTGLKTAFLWKWVTDNGFMLEYILHAYAGYDFHMSQQDYQSAGWEFFGFTELNLEKSLSDTISLGLGNQVYMKQTIYEEAENVFQVAYSGSLYAKVRIK
ncbi:MAG: DUF3943 domain-containing protein [Treponema sp.]|nr:DUF3943 domain-containing protein [Treponema sp.]